MTAPSAPPRAAAAVPASARRIAIRCALLLAWSTVLWLVPDPRPLGAPGWAVAAVASLGIGEAGARAIATLVLRSSGLALLGALSMWASGARPWERRCFAVLVAAPCLAVAVLWANCGYFPIRPQIRIAAISALCGALLAVALRRSRIAAGVLAALVGGLFAWGTATGIGDELDAAARATGRHVLAAAPGVPDGDAGFQRLLELAFAFAEDNPHGTDAVLPNRAAVLALAVILGDEAVAKVAGRRLDLQRLPEAEALRARITLYGRKDWPRHFWVSAGLTLLADPDRSIAVGLTKELMDSTAGGTGFSFADVAADAAGSRFAVAATRDAASARAMQARILAGARNADFCPDARDLPEGIARDDFQARYGGLGGAGTQKLVDEIRRRLAACPGLQ
jgi:hypothetical protein